MLVGEVVNEDSVPAFVNVGATLLDAQGNEFAQESSFDKIAHKLLPKQVTPYRIDFPGMRLKKSKTSAWTRKRCWWRRVPIRLSK